MDARRPETSLCERSAGAVHSPDARHQSRRLFGRRIQTDAAKILWGETDITRTNGLALIDTLKSEGVRIETRETPGGIHGSAGGSTSTRARRSCVDDVSSVASARLGRQRGSGSLRRQPTAEQTMIQRSRRRAGCRPSRMMAVGALLSLIAAAGCSREGAASTRRFGLAGVVVGHE